MASFPLVSNDRLLVTHKKWKPRLGSSESLRGFNNQTCSLSKSYFTSSSAPLLGLSNRFVNLSEVFIEIETKAKIIVKKIDSNSFSKGCSIFRLDYQLQGGSTGEDNSLVPAESMTSIEETKDIDSNKGGRNVFSKISKAQGSTPVWQFSTRKIDHDEGYLLGLMEEKGTAYGSAPQSALISVRKRKPSNQVVGFNDVEGVDAAKVELMEIVLCLQGAINFSKLGQSYQEGFVGAELANIVNEAALLAARRGADCVSREDIMEAIERAKFGINDKQYTPKCNSVSELEKLFPWVPSFMRKNSTRSDANTRTLGYQTLS
ncbi:hypothetical protein HAX54_026142 [Datura stramonium]|uniref:AAA ATPase AAA+ lid domain-containing protein n=1 Tax=Datura stramonium TaxID=4076 RepID=A0ABS8V2R6_DATST|nr:hypothetical protein [Datura stramonium]